MPLLGPKTTCILQKPATTVDSQGGAYASWAAVVSFNGILQPISAKEAIDYNRLTATSTHYVFVDYYSIKAHIAEFIESNRLYINSVAYNITGVDNYHNCHLEITFKKIS